MFKAGSSGLRLCAGKSQFKLFFVFLAEGKEQGNKDLLFKPLTDKTEGLSLETKGSESCTEGPDVLFAIESSEQKKGSKHKLN